MIYSPSYKNISNKSCIAEPVSEKIVQEQKRAFKYADFFDTKKKASCYVRDILNQMEKHIENKHKYVLVDIKTSLLSAGNLPAYGFWHTDCTLNLKHESRPEHHVIFISGAGSQTEFVSSEMEIDFNDIDLKKWSPLYEEKVFAAIANSKAKLEKINERQLYSYGRDLHRACPATFSGPRILVRMTETDLIRPTKGE